MPWMIFPWHLILFSGVMGRNLPAHTRFLSELMGRYFLSATTSYLNNLPTLFSQIILDVGVS